MRAGRMRTETGGPIMGKTTPPPKRPQGRPAMGEDKRQLIAMRMAPAELEAIRAAADRAGLPYTVWMRQTCLRAAGSR